MTSPIGRLLLSTAALLAAALPVQAQSSHKLLGGPTGIVKSATGDMLEGMMVQLISKKTAIRTTVYSDTDGRYEFPKLDPGTYTLRIALPREYQPFAKERRGDQGHGQARGHHAEAHLAARAAAAEQRESQRR
jgi:hypothetical protein